MLKLTQAMVDAARAPAEGSRTELRDSIVPGLALRAYPSGVRSFVLNYRVAGRKKVYTIGSAAVLTLALARDKAKRLRAGMTMDGTDPLLERQQERTAATFGDLCVRFVEYQKSRNRTWRGDETRIARTFKAWKPRPLESITRAEVEALVAKIGARAPYEANRVTALVHRMFELADRWDMVPATFANPARGIQRFKEHARERALSAAEVKRLWTAIDAEPNPILRALVRLYLLTGARRSELLRARWVDIETDRSGRSTLTIPKSKSGSTLRIPLSGAALDALDELPRREDNEYIFASRLHGQPLSNVSKSWNAIRKRAGLAGVRVHDLRRTLGTWLAESGLALHVIGATLGHSTPAVTAKHYARLSSDGAVRTALEAHSAAIEAAVHATPAKAARRERKTRPARR
jgi:integrase